MAPSNALVPQLSGKKQSKPVASVYNWPDLKHILPHQLTQELSSNNPASKAALQYVKSIRRSPKELLKAAKRRAEEIDHAIQQLQAEKIILTDEHRVRATLNQICDTVASPVRHLPEDVLREIFQHAIKRHSFPSPEPNSAPLSFARVCSAWRFVVLSSPRLWSTLYLRVEKLSHERIRQRYDAIQTWFGRANSLPLQFFLYVDESNLSSAAEPISYAIKIFLKAIAPWTPRIHRLGIGSMDWTGLMTHFANIDWDLCNLRRLDILGQKAYDPSYLDEQMESLQSVMDRITMFRKATLLTTVVASQEITWFLGSLVFIPWQQITDLYVDEENNDISLVGRLAEKCPSLRNASLKNVITQHSTIVPAVVSHYNLEVLELGMRTEDYQGIVDFFTNNTFPRLAFLQLHISDAFDMSPCDTGGPYGKFVPFPSLHTLIITGKPLPTHLVLNLLRNCPVLTTFHMHISDGPNHVPMTDVNEVCQRLTIKNGRCKLAPYLEELVLGYLTHPSRLPKKKTFTLDSATISRFVHSRTQHVPSTFSTLKKVAFTDGFHFFTDIREDIANLCDATVSSGVEVMVTEDSNTYASHLPSALTIYPFEQGHFHQFHSFSFMVRHCETLSR